MVLLRLQMTQRRKRSPLHNFHLPSLNWGCQLYLRPINLVDPRRPSIDPPPSQVRLRHLPPLLIHDGEGDESIRARLRRHLRRMEAAGAGKTVSDAAAAPAPAPEPEVASPWNLRKRRPVCESPATIAGDDGRKHCSGDSPPPKAPETRPRSLRLRGLAPEEVVEVKPRKREPHRLSIALTKKEIEDDLLAMTGSKPSRRPKKRAKIVQKNLDELFPGLWLSYVTPDLYEVNDLQEQNKS